MTPRPDPHAEEMPPDELERRKAEACEWHFKLYGNRGHVPEDRCGIREIKLDRRRNGNYR